MRTKHFVAPLKAVGVESVTTSGEGDADGGGEGVALFEGYASVFGNKDTYGDVMVKGAFADTLANDYGADGAGVPCYWGHRFDDPMMNLGATVEAREDDRGLRVKVALDLRNPYAVQAHRLLSEGRVRQMSFAFDIVHGDYGGSGVEGEDDDSAYYIRKVALHEVSVVPIGANRETEIIRNGDTVDTVADSVQGGLVDGDAAQTEAPPMGAGSDVAELGEQGAGAEQAKVMADAAAEWWRVLQQASKEGTCQLYESI